MKSVTRRRLFAIPLVTSLGWLLSCGVSPTLPPLPPPEEPSRFETVAEGLVLVEGRIPIAEAKVFVINHRTQEIAGQFVHDFEYAIEVGATPGDFLQLWYSAASLESETVSFELPSE